MGLPRAREAKSFYRSAKQRFEDARFLLAAGRTTGAVYLAGYGVECILKSLLIAFAPPRGRDDIVDSFRGAKAHDFEWLRREYRKIGGPTIPQTILEHFVLISTWSTSYRYAPGMIEPRNAEEFLAAAEAIIQWADGRM